MKGVSIVAVLWLVATFCTVAVHSDGCYQHYDHAAQYHLDHEAPSYPWDEVEKAMGQNPMLSQVLAAGTKVPTGRPPGQYYDPVSVVCPSQRFMLKAFQVDNKQCYIIKPEVQQARYVNCNNDQDRNCHYCSLARAGVSKCEEDYEWLDVWAYCKPVHTPVYYPKVIHPDPPSLPNPHPGYPQPAIIQPDPQPYPQPHPQPYPQPQPHPQPYNPPVQPVHPEPYKPQPQPEYKPYPQPVVKPYPEPRVEEKPTPYIPVGYPKQPPQYPERPQPVYHTDKIYAGRTYGKPWKRSVPVYEGSVEKIALYLPYQCSCKNYKC